MRRFEGKTIIVTGAGSGIGAAVARRFVAEGGNVAVFGRDGGKLTDALSDCPQQQLLIVQGDVSKDADVKRLVSETVARFGRLDVLVNNAGVADMGKITETTDEMWRNTMSINVDGVFYCIRAAMPHLIQSKGSVINTSSVSGIGGDNNMAVYTATKGAISNLTRSMAIDHGPDGVRINAICPALTVTDLTQDMVANPKIMAAFKARIPLGRPAEPDDIAGAFLFLASDDARFITGVNLPVDGGVNASNGQPIYFL